MKHIQHWLPLFVLLVLSSCAGIAGAYQAYKELDACNASAAKIFAAYTFPCLILPSVTAMALLIKQALLDYTLGKTFEDRSQ